MYPAMDLTAGEKKMSTMETILAPFPACIWFWGNSFWC